MTTDFEDLATSGGSKPKGQSAHTRMPVVPAVVLSLVVLAAILAPWIAPHDPKIGKLSLRLIPPAWQEGGTKEFLLGTDSMGRDILSRVLHGARVSLIVGALGSLLAGSIGTFIGLVAGYRRRWVDSLLMRLTDVTLALPLMLMAIVLVALLGASFKNVIIVIVVLLWPYYARIVRGETLVIAKSEFVDLARISGASSTRIVLRHILPNVMPTILVLATLQIALIILLEASLSFLGAGIPPPTPAWGLMVADGRDLIGTAWWISVIPGAAIFVVVLATNLLGDWVRDRFDPKLRQL